jgi:hypothetical protein
MWLRLALLGALVAGCGGKSEVATGADAAGGIDAPSSGIDAAGGGDGSVTDAGRPGHDGGRRDGGMPFDGGGPPRDGGLRDCNPSGTCTSGPVCGIRCCGEGEWCDTSTDTCHCGAGDSCMMGDMCAAAGPVGPPACGIICCGTSGPCPL